MYTMAVLLALVGLLTPALAQTPKKSQTLQSPAAKAAPGNPAARPVGQSGSAGCGGYVVSGAGWRTTIVEAKLVPSFASGELLDLAAPEGASLLVVSFDVGSGTDAAVESMKSIVVREKNSPDSVIRGKIRNVAGPLRDLPEATTSRDYFIHMGARTFSLGSKGPVYDKATPTRVSYIAAADRGRTALVLEFPQLKRSCALDALLDGSPSAP